MKFKNSGSEIFVPDNAPLEEAIERTTHMAIVAHQDDIEILAHHGILECFGKKDKWLLGTVVTDGAGSPRDDIYANYTDEEMKKIRRQEQKKAAYVGEYGAAVLLDYTSSSVKDPKNAGVVDDLKKLISLAKPEVIYTHNLADKHDTHISVLLRTIQALRELPENIRPKKLYGCEAWRSLDWLVDSDKVFFDVSPHPNIAAAVIGVHDSQICGGKRYDLATAGRRVANATYADPHKTDSASSIIYGMDMTPLIQDIELDIEEFIQNYIKHFSKDVSNRLKKFL